MRQPLWCCLVLSTCLGPAATADDLAVLADQLSAPEAARSLPAFAAIDTTATLFGEALRPLANPLEEGGGGRAELVERLQRARQEILRRAEVLGTFPLDFANTPVAIPDAAPAYGDVRVELDLAPAREMLSLLGSGVTDPSIVAARLRASSSWPVFEALLQHRSQSFYPTPLSLELLALNMALAAGSSPLPRLYAAVNPYAFLNFGDVSRNLPRYVALVDALDAGRGAIGGEVVRRLRPYLPADAALVRRVAVLFAWGADGWAAADVAGVDLEYFKDDLSRLLGVLTHETYHVAQAALRVTPDAAPRGGPQASWQKALDTLYREGTATHVAPPQELSTEERARRVARGRQLLAELAQAVADADEDAADRLLNEGRRGAGPLYWLGAAMAAAIESHRGPAAVAACLRGGTPQFLQSFQEAALAGYGEPLPATWLALR